MKLKMMMTDDEMKGRMPAKMRKQMQAMKQERRRMMKKSGMPRKAKHNKV